FKYAGTGPAEKALLARFYHERFGLKVTHADPGELMLKDGEVCYEGDPVDLVYRDFEVRDLLELEQAGMDPAPLRLLFKQNRVISSITAELDQKSCWEVLTDPRFTHKYFS